MNILNVNEIEISRLQRIAVSFSSLLGSEERELLEFTSSAQWIGFNISASSNGRCGSFSRLPDDSDMQP